MSIHSPKAPRHLGLSLSLVLIVGMILALLITATVMAFQGGVSTAHGSAGSAVALFATE